MRRAVLVSVLTALSAVAACGETPAKPEIPAGAEPQPVPNAPPGEPPVSAAPAAFVGDWATSPALCTEGRFRITETSVTTAGEVHCDWDGSGVVRTATGWTIAARCSAEGPPQPAALTLTMSKVADADSLLIAGAPFAAAPLNRCPAEPAAPAPAG